MKTCYRCDRHFYVEDQHCPFCGPSDWEVTAKPVRNASLGLLVGLSSISCDSDSEDTTTTTTTTTTSATGTDSMPMTETTPMETQDGTTTTGTVDPTTTDAGGSYYAGPAATSTGWEGSSSGSGSGSGSGSSSGGNNTTSG